MPIKFAIWNSYDELSREYIGELPLNELRTQYDPKSLFLDPQKPTQQDLSPKPGSEHATFMYAVKKIKSLIQVEINTLDESSQSKVINQFTKDCVQLIQHFENKVGIHFSQESQDKLSFEKIGTDFLADAEAMIKKYDPQIESDKSWTPFLKNVALLLSGIGTLPALFSIAKKAVTGNYSFFDKKSISDEELVKLLPSQNKLS